MDEDLDWIKELRWRGEPRPACGPVGPAAPTPDDPRVGELMRRNEALLARLERLARLAPEFERRLQEAGAAYEARTLELESRLNAAALERKKLLDEIAALQAALSWERESRADAARREPPR